jgi:hypothetical protein
MMISLSQGNMGMATDEKKRFLPGFFASGRALCRLSVSDPSQGAAVRSREQILSPWLDHAAFAGSLSGYRPGHEIVPV